MLLRTILFPLEPKSNGYAAEYDICTKQLTWRQPPKQVHVPYTRKQLLLIKGICFIPIATTCFMVCNHYFPLLSKDTRFFIDRYAPALLGLLLFLTFDALMLVLRKRYPLVEVEPDTQQQYDYFVAMFDLTIRKNLWPRYSYLGIYLSAATISLFFAPFSYYAYLYPEHFLGNRYTYVHFLLVASFCLSMVPMLWHHLLLKHLIFLKLIRKMNKQRENSKGFL